MTTLKHFIEALELAKSLDYNLDLEDFNLEDLEDDYNEIRDFIYDETDLDNCEVLDERANGNSSKNIHFQFPSGHDYSASGEFAYDKENEFYCDHFQDLNGKVYKVIW